MSLNQALHKHERDGEKLTNRQIYRQTQQAQKQSTRKPKRDTEFEITDLPAKWLMK